MKKIDLKGKRFGRLVVIEKTSERLWGSVVWKCKCDCGNFKNASAKNLRQGFVKSCGCLVQYTNSLKAKKIKDQIKPDNGKRCCICGENCYPNYFYCSGCHINVSNKYCEEYI